MRNRKKPKTQHNPATTNKLEVSDFRRNGGGLFVTVRSSGLFLVSFRGFASPSLKKHLFIKKMKLKSIRKLP